MLNCAGFLAGPARHGLCDREGMSTINVPVLYQTETFSSGFRQRSSGGGTADHRGAAAKPASGQKPMKEADFLVHLMVSGDPDFRKVLGRRDIAHARENAYAFASAHKASRLAEYEKTELRIA
jgi:hypothetical protein